MVEACIGQDTAQRALVSWHTVQTLPNMHLCHGTQSRCCPTCTLSRHTAAFAHANSMFKTNQQKQVRMHRRTAGARLAVCSCQRPGLQVYACRADCSLDEVEPLLAEGGLGPPAGLDTMRPNTGARVVAPAAIIERTHPSPVSSCTFEQPYKVCLRADGSCVECSTG